jgi:glucose-1-phosphate adenylyltransferase
MRTMKTRDESASRTERPALGGDDLAGRTTAVVLAGGKGTRLDPLTRNICKPALPFGAIYRCIDFSLSNCVNSGIRTIGVATRYKPDALLAHLQTRWNGTSAGNEPLVHAWRAEERTGRSGVCGTADAVYRNLATIREQKDALVLVLAGDHIYKMDYRPMLAAHRARNAAVTIGCIEAPVESALGLGVLSVAADGCVERLVEKPRSTALVPCKSSGNALASMGIYVFDAALLARILPLDAARVASGHDFASDILPQLIEGGHVHAFAFRDPGNTAYWRDIGTLEAYWRAHMDLLGPDPHLTLDDPRWPIGSLPPPRRIAAATTRDSGSIEDSIVPTSSRVAGEVTSSVLGDDVEVARGAQLARSVVLPGAVIGAGSRLNGVIVDAGSRVPAATVIERLADSDAPPVVSANCTVRAEYRRIL